MGRPAETQSAYFIDHASPLAADVQRALTEGPYRCNIMMVHDGEQALTILRQEARSSGGRPPFPHVVLIYGGLHDGRAAKLVDALRGDPTYSSIPLISVVAPADHAVGAEGLRLESFAMATLQPMLSQSGFWWVMAKLG
jgi:hypothetical protein